MSTLDGPGEGTWSVFAMKVVEQRDELRHALAGEAEHIKSLEGLLVDALRERDEARADFANACDVGRRQEARAEKAERERDALHGAMMLAEERGAEWAIRARAQVVYSLVGDEAYRTLAREVCAEARKQR